MPSAAIIGGRGQSGLAIASRLVREGWSVTATTSGPVPSAEIVPGIAWVTLVRDGTADLALAVGSGVDVVIDITAFTVTHARQVVALGDRVGSAIVMSTLSVYADAQGRSLGGSDGEAGFPAFPVPITEECPTVEAGEGDYSARKVAVEKYLRAEAPWPVTILRPGAIHGPYSHHLREWYFVKRVLDRRDRAVLPYGGASVFQPTATVNLAELVALVAGRPGNRTLNCADLDPPSVAEISIAVDDVMGWSTDRVLVDGPPPAPNVGDHPWAVPSPVVASMARAEEELGYRQAATYREALPTTVAWAVEAATGRDWRDVFTTLAGYPTDMFDYAAEDDFLTARTG